jgi:hypothetical protein
MAANTTTAAKHHTATTAAPETSSHVARGKWSSSFWDCTTPQNDCMEPLSLANFLL